jgi:hypothetical protein
LDTVEGNFGGGDQMKNACGQDGNYMKTGNIVEKITKQGMRMR